MSDLRLPDLNKVIIAGRVAFDPELRYISSGRAVCRIRIANTRYYRTKDGERREETCWVDAKCWDKQAEFVGERIKKGRPVLIEGRLKSDEWEDKTTGQKRTKIEISAQRIVPLDWEEGGGPGSGGPGGGRAYDGPSRADASPSSPPPPRPIEEPVPEDDIPF